MSIRIVNVAHRRRLKANESIQIGKVCTIKIDVESRAYPEDQWNQSDSDDDPEYNTGRAIILCGNKCLAQQRRELSNEIVSTQHAICHAHLLFHSARAFRMACEWDDPTVRSSKELTDSMLDTEKANICTVMNTFGL